MKVKELYCQFENTLEAVKFLSEAKPGYLYTLYNHDDVHKIVEGDDVLFSVEGLEDQGPTYHTLYEFVSAYWNWRFFTTD